MRIIFLPFLTLFSSQVVYIHIVSFFGKILCVYIYICINITFPFNVPSNDIPQTQHYPKNARPNAIQSYFLNVDCTDKTSDLSQIVLVVTRRVASPYVPI